jgi:hypothetical protein
LLSTPRTDPGVRDSRTGLPPWVFDGEAFARPRMKDAGLGQELSRKLSYPLLCRPVSLAPALERSLPKIHDIVPKGAQGFAVCRHSMIREVSAYDLSQPLTLQWDRFVHSSLQFFLNGSQSGSHPISTRLPVESPVCLDLAVLGVRPHNGQTQSDGFCPKRELFHSLPHIRQKASGFTFVLETDDDIIGKVHYDDSTPGMALAPPLATCGQGGLYDGRRCGVRQSASATRD